MTFAVIDELISTIKVGFTRRAVFVGFSLGGSEFPGAPILVVPVVQLHHQY